MTGSEKLKPLWTRTLEGRGDGDGRLSPAVKAGLALAGALVNFALGSVVHLLQLPVYLDSVFTMVVTIHLGLPAGILTAVLTNGLLALTGQVLWPFVCCNILTALISYAFLRSGSLDYLSGYLWLGIAAAAGNGLLGSVLAYYLFEGVTAVHGIDRLVMSILATGRSILGAVFWAGMFTNVLDKTLSAVFVFVLKSSLPRVASDSVPPHEAK
jgi:energy-coupling factor transport system substrate-specific component